MEKRIKKINRLEKEAKQLVLKLLPPKDYGENFDCERLYKVIGLMRREAVRLLMTETPAPPPAVSPKPVPAYACQYCRRLIPLV